MNAMRIEFWARVHPDPRRLFSDLVLVTDGELGSSGT